MYDRQRADALSDFQMTNEYNSPQAQMERLKMAGLNPNLVYENGATQTASPVRSSSPGSYSPKPAHWDLTSSLAAFYDTQVKQAQIDNLKTQNTVQVQDAILKAAQTVATMATTEGTNVSTKQKQFDYEMSQNLKSISLEAAQAALNKTKSETQVLVNRDEREAAMNAQNLMIAAENVLNLRAQRANTKAEHDAILQRIDNLKKDAELKQLDINLKKLGIQPGDALWQRVLGQLINGTGIGGSVGSLIGSAINPNRSNSAEKKTMKWMTPFGRSPIYHFPR